MDQKKIGEFIKIVRKEKNMTQSELAAHLGVTDKSVSNWENGRCMPDLSLFKPLCDELAITLNELLAGDHLEGLPTREKDEENVLGIIAYADRQLREKTKIIGIIMLIVGIVTTISAMTIFPIESSWGAIYAIVGVVLSTLGLYNILQKNRIVMSVLFALLFVGGLLTLDFLSVIKNGVPPRFSYIITTKSDTVFYASPFVNVFKINANQTNEYILIDKKKEYTLDTVPKVPFNRTMSGIDNLERFRSSFIGDNTNDSALLQALPLAEFGFDFEIDSVNLGLFINYHTSETYIDNQNRNYQKKALIYNSVAIFGLISNVEYVKYNFSGTSYETKRASVEDYPHFDEIFDREVDKEKFGEYVENRLQDEEFVENIFADLFLKI